MQHISTTKHIQTAQYFIVYTVQTVHLLYIHHAVWNRATDTPQALSRRKCQPSCVSNWSFLCILFHFVVNSGQGIDQVIRWETVTTWTCCLGCQRMAWSTVSRRRTNSTSVCDFIRSPLFIVLSLFGCFRWRGPEQRGLHPRYGDPWAAEGCHGTGAEQ